MSEVRRRRFPLAAGALLSAPLAARAQQARKLPVVGFLHPGSPYQSPALTGLRKGLRDIGHVDGETVKIEARCGLGRPETLLGLAEELVRLKVDVLVMVGSHSVKAARQAT